MTVWILQLQRPFTRCPAHQQGYQSITVNTQVANSEPRALIRDTINFVSSRALITWRWWLLIQFICQTVTALDVILRIIWFMLGHHVRVNRNPSLCKLLVRYYKPLNTFNRLRQTLNVSEDICYAALYDGFVMTALEMEVEARYWVASVKSTAPFWCSSRVT